MCAPDDALAQLAESLSEAQQPLFITGAGLSADSGLPTYRGVGGLYERQSTEEGIPIEVALSGQMLLHRPEVAWKYLWQIGSAVRRARPNRGHEVLADIERQKPDTWVLTQNIDGFHRASGSKNVIEVHGRMGGLACLACDFVTEAEALLGVQSGDPPPLPPRCPECGAVLRPSVVLFGEALPQEALVEMEEVIFGRPRDLVVVIGTTAVFPYIEMPVRDAQQRGIPTFEINPAPSAVSVWVDGRVAEGAAAALNRLHRLMGLASP